MEMNIATIKDDMVILEGFNEIKDMAMIRILPNGITIVPAKENDAEKTFAQHIVKISVEGQKRYIKDAALVELLINAKFKTGYFFEMEKGLYLLNK